ncbi:MAG: PadR family transcriptional regulator [Clostridia bacterium]|nr:PadR family transcriptional regulator [Clostridia bacterium]
MIFQLNSSLLDACVLAVLMKSDTYGYELTQNLKNSINVSESTLYPVLRRLQKNNFLETYDNEFQGRNRRYYKITNEGKKQLKEYNEEWEIYKNKIENILGGSLE